MYRLIVPILFSFLIWIPSYAQYYFDHLTIVDGLTHNTVHCIEQDSIGYIWIGTSYGLNRYNGYELKKYIGSSSGSSTTSFKGVHISALYEDSKGNLWVGTKKNGINLKYFDRDTFVNLSTNAGLDLIQNTEISSFYEDTNGSIWITTIGKGVMQYDPFNERTVVYNSSNAGLSSDITFSAVMDHEGILWIAAAGGGINMLLPEKSNFVLSHEMLPNSANLAGYRKKMCLDGAFLWLATQGTGLYKVKLSDLSYERFSIDDIASGIPTNVVMDVIKDKAGNIYAATDGAGLFVYDPIKNAFKPVRNKNKDQTSLNTDALYCLLMDNTDNLWIGSFNGGVNILKSSKVKFDFYQLGKLSNEERNSNSVLSMLEHSNGELLIGTDGGGLLIAEDVEKLEKIQVYKSDQSTSNSISGNTIRTLFEDSRGLVWVGHFGSGVDQYDPFTGLFKSILPNSILSISNIWAFDELVDGRILIGTLGQGLFLLNDKTMELTKVDLRSTEIMDVLVDHEGKIWVGYAEMGLDVLNASGALLSSFEYDELDPFSLSDNGVRAIFQDKLNQIWIGTERGGLNLKIKEGFKRFDHSSGLLSNNISGICEDSKGYLWLSGFAGLAQFDNNSYEVINYDFRRQKDANQFNQQAILFSKANKILAGGIYGLNLIDAFKPADTEYDYKVFLSQMDINNETISLTSKSSNSFRFDQPIEHAELVHLDYKDRSFTLYFANNDFANSYDESFSYLLEDFDLEWQTTEKGSNIAYYTNIDPGTYKLRYKYKDVENDILLNIHPPLWQTAWFRVLILLIAIVGAWLGLNLYTQQKVAVHKRQVLQLQNEKLASEINQSNSKLMFNSAQIAQKNEVLKSLLKDIKLVKEKEDLTSIISKINFELNNSDYWNEFHFYFAQIDKSFAEEVNKLHPSLTKNDLRIIYLIRLNLSSKEISSLLNISIRATEQARYRLKKRLGLSNEINLATYILNLRKPKV